MNYAALDRIVKAVLYEGYLLYPYRPSAMKNRQRFNFGVIYPCAYSETQGSGDACAMQTECLVQANPDTQCAVRVRFLRMVARSIHKPKATDAGARYIVPPPSRDSNFLDSFESVERLEVNGKTYQPWQEAAEETIELAEFNLFSLAAQPMLWPFRLSPWQSTETIRDQGGAAAGIIRWEKKTIAGMIELTAGVLQHNLIKLKARITNGSRIDSAHANRDAALQQSLVSTHTILQLHQGEFISLTDPPEPYRAFARSCQNIGTWPILVGAPGERDTMLSSPIILSDYPEIAPESPGDLFDGAEIDEILSLRILTMTDDEKREMRESDARARQILERTESLGEEHWAKLHGALRGLRSTKENTP